ncbi:hypothetical protein [Anaeromyxobacter diazotrophicus]|uniref:Lipoprotein n=1 Tax=Anaeromyxobacter diazotrophicus TaxID=2590199 RepID=A0A7I9VT42_9BACT|nr:hypothetical protein [Anaeromyxobacter diazotrophicus]GEJ59471.1 hypothetical protein AMYX_42120 [Anaeromyxobacter diazotrophicus]
MNRLTWGIALALAAGCATSGGGHGGATVSDADFGRLQVGQMGPVDQARQFLASAHDEQARAKLRLQEGQGEAQMAKADAQTAKAAAERADAQSKMANNSREPSQLELARSLKEQADVQQRAAKAHADYADKASAARKQAVAAADKQVALGEAKVELAKLQALQQAGIPAATKYDLTKFQQRVGEAQKDFDAALQKTRDEEAQATASQQTWEDARRQAQAQAVPLGAPQTGTGTGR